MIRSNFESIKSHIAKMRHKNAPSKSVNFLGAYHCLYYAIIHYTFLKYSDYKKTAVILTTACFTYTQYPKRFIWDIYTSI